MIVSSQFRYSWWRALHRWQRVAVVGALVGGLAISAALIAVQPTGTTPTTPASATHGTSSTRVPVYPPGTRYYYRRSQWQAPEPLPQQ